MRLVSQNLLLAAIPIVKDGLRWVGLTFGNTTIPKNTIPNSRKSGVIFSCRCLLRASEGSAPLPLRGSQHPTSISSAAGLTWARFMLLFAL